MVNNVSLFRKRRLAFAGIITGDRQLTSYSFGKFDFLPDERRLKKAGKEIPLGARAFDLLIFLVENRHRVVTKAEMLDAVWPDIAVEESNLTVQVSALRKSLGADAMATIPGRGYQFVLAESAAEAKGPDSKSKPGSSILVLPFANTSNDPDQEYFSDGISEDIITDLCKVRALSVIARNTAFTFKGRAVDVAEIAGRLGVSHVVEGSVRKAGNRLRINAQLVDGATGHPVWAERFDRNLTDIFALQDEIAQAIVAALKVRLIPDERAAILARPTDNPEAYEIYLQARHHHDRLSQQDYQIAARLAKQAIEIDPKYERAWALLAVSQAWLSTLEGGDDSGLAAAERALELNPESAEALAAKSRILAGQGNWDDALALTERSLQLDPQSYDVCFYAGSNYFLAGRYEEAIELLERAAALSPDALPPLSPLGMAYTATGQESKAIETSKRSLERADRALERNDSDVYPLMHKVLGLAVLGEAERAKQLISRIRAIDPNDHTLNYNIGCAMVRLGEMDVALDCFAPTTTMGEPISTLIWMRKDTDLDALRSAPRFQELMANLEARAAAAKSE